MNENSLSGVVTTAEAIASEETVVQHDQGKAPTSTDAPGFAGLSGKAKVLGGVVAVFGSLIAVIGFIGSYRAVQKLAVSWGMGWFSYLFPVGIDFGIVALLALDLLMTWLRMRFAMFRYMAWLLTGVTVAFNAASGYPKLLPMAGHAVIPLLFIVVMEGARYAVARIAALEAGKPEIDGVRFMRWVLSPVATFKLWRKMRLWEITSYDEVVDLEQRRLVYRAVLKYHHGGRGWSRKASTAEKLPLQLAKFGRPVPQLVSPETDFLQKYAVPSTREVTVERIAPEVAPQARPELSAGLPVDLVAKLTDLVDRAEQAAVQAAPVKLEKPEVPVNSLQFFAPQQLTAGQQHMPQPAAVEPNLEEMFGSPLPADLYDLERTGEFLGDSTVYPAVAPRPSVNVRIPHQGAESRQDVEPVGVEADALVVGEPEESAPLSGKAGLLALYNSLSPAQRQLSANQLAQILAPKVGLTEGSTRKYLGDIRAGRLTAESV